MEYEQIKNWLKDNEYQNSGLRTDKYHRIDLYLSDVLYHYSKETFQQLQTRIKELEGTIENMKAIAINLQQPEQGYTITSVDYRSDNETELITVTEEVYNGCFSEITKTKCCGIEPITNENYCPNCGRKIKK